MKHLTKLFALAIVAVALALVGNSIFQESSLSTSTYALPDLESVLEPNPSDHNQSTLDTIPRPNAHHSKIVTKRFKHASKRTGIKNAIKTVTSPLLGSYAHSNKSQKTKKKQRKVIPITKQKVFVDNNSKSETKNNVKENKSDDTDQKKEAADSKPPKSLITSRVQIPEELSENSEAYLGFR